MPLSNPYMFATLLSSIVILVMGVCLLVMSMPQGAQLRNYRISRRLLAVAYIILAVQSIAGAFWDERIHAETITPLLQACLFTYALITLLNHDYFTRRRVLWQLVVICLIIVLIILNLYILPAPVKALSYLITAAYFGLFAYYVWIFYCEYRNYKRRADNFYAGGERNQLRWTVQIFVIAAGIGAVAGIVDGDDFVFWIFIAVYTLVYVYMAIRYINYVALFYHIAPAVAGIQDEAAGREISEGYIIAALNKWTGSQGFLSADVSLESLSQQLRISPVYLSRHINRTYGQNFRSWINAQRIAEAQRLITGREDLSYAEIGNKVGIPSSSTFYRQFVAATGVTPAEYRRKFGTPGTENKL